MRFLGTSKLTCFVLNGRYVPVITIPHITSLIIIHRLGACLMHIACSSWTAKHFAVSSLGRSVVDQCPFALQISIRVSGVLSYLFCNKTLIDCGYIDMASPID